MGLLRVFGGRRREAALFVCPMSAGDPAQKIPRLPGRQTGERWIGEGKISR